MRNWRWNLLWITLIVVLPTVQAADYQPFVGKYEGKYLAPDGNEKKNRDLSVEIDPIKEGFNLSWETVTYKKDEPKSKSYSIDFLKTDRSHIYKAAQKKNLFGGREPLDPLKGEPFAWARIMDETLTVYVLIITEDGGYEMQTYDRILTEDHNLLVKFSRIRDGELFRTIEAKVIRQ